MKITALIVSVMLSGCATAPAGEQFLMVSGTQGEVLRIQASGRVIWKVRKNEAAKVMIGLLLQRDKELDQAKNDLAESKQASDGLKKSVDSCGDELKDLKLACIHPAAVAPVLPTPAISTPAAQGEAK